MTRDDLDVFLARLLELAELLKEELSEARQVMYFDALKDLPTDRVLEALEQAKRERVFFPKPVEIRTLAVGDSEDRTELAWVNFRAAMRKAGSYASLSIADAALAETIVAMFNSWAGACAQDLSPEMWAAKRKEFGRVYRVMVQRNLSGSRYLPGAIEQSNGGREDWLRYVTMHRLDANGPSGPLTLAEAEHERLQLAAAAHGLSRIAAADLVAQLVPVKEEAR